MESVGQLYPALVAAAEKCKTASDFQNVLKPLTDFAGADGCIVWEIFHKGTPQRRYVKLLEYFPKQTGQASWYFLPDTCVTASAVSENRVQIVDDLTAAMALGRVPDGEFLTARGISSFCAIPTSFGPTREASVNFYWGNHPRAEAIDQIEAAARIIPALSHSVMNQMGFDLLRIVGECLSAKEDGLRQVITAVSEAFNALEASIYLGNPTEAPRLYRCHARVWPWRHEIPREYSYGGKDLTSWVLDNNKTVRFVDLGHFAEEAINFEGISWATQSVALSAARDTFGAPLPPLGYLGVPIHDRDRVVGAIHCSQARSAPYLFDERQVHILKLVADQLGHWWGNQLAVRAAETETKRFTVLVEGIARLHQVASAGLREKETEIQKPDMSAIWEETLSLVSEIVPWKDALSIRAVSKEKRDLFFVANQGKMWNKDGRAAERLATRYPLDGDYAGTRVIRDQKVLVESQAGRPGRPSSKLFPDAKVLIHAPIRVGKEAVGVLDIRGFTEEATPPNVSLMCDLIGRQLGLFQSFQDQFWQLKEQKQRVSKLYDEQTQIYEDFLHQLRNPLVKASMLSKSSMVNETHGLRQLRSQVQKAVLFADTINHFVALAKDEPIDAPLSIVEHDHFVDLLRESAADQQLLAQEMEKSLRFVVDERSFEPLWSISAQFTEHLFLHCLFNLLDNATKYSRRGTQVDICGRHDEKNARFLISVSNEGFRILPEERKRLIQRGERGNRAMLTTAGGRGIGLWIVDKFMQAMKGELIVLPTDSRSRNVISLALSCRKSTKHKEFS